MYLALWLMRRWRLPATPAFSFPDAVILKRFFTPDLVFSLGISRRAPKVPSSGRVDEPPWHALGPGGSEGAGEYGKGGTKARSHASRGVLAITRPANHRAGRINSAESANGAPV